MKIAVAGCGYVGLANGLVLARHHEVVFFDVLASRIAQLQQRICPLQEPAMQRFLQQPDLHLSATLDPVAAFGEADCVLIATPTDYDPLTGVFNTDSITTVVQQVLALRPQATLLLKSTVPIGYTRQARQRFGTERLVFSPEFLREGRALHDSLQPSRIVVGDLSALGAQMAALLQSGAQRADVPVLLTGSDEAEAIKLFANTYLAMRVAYFNELDSFALQHGLDSRQIIDAVGLDERIGTHYNNPSFGYGGYCLPKDSRQLHASFGQVPQALVGAIVQSNETRMRLMADAVLARQPRRVGVYRLTMKAGSDNFRDASVWGVMAHLRAAGVPLQVYEPTVAQPEIHGYPVQPDLATFLQANDLILANRRTAELQGVAHKVFSRDLFGHD